LKNEGKRRYKEIEGGKNMHSYHGKTAIFHYDGGLDGDIIIIDKENNQVRFDAKDLIRLFTKEGLIIPKNPQVLFEILTNEEKELFTTLKKRGNIKTDSCYRNDKEHDLFINTKKLEEYGLVKDQFGIGEYKLTDLGYDILELIED
jgi:predicted transcriptional regulator